MATVRIDDLSFIGAVTSDTQSLAWPRSGVYDTEGRAVDQNAVPQAVKDAQAEMALALLKEDLTEDDGTKGVKRVKAGSVEVEYSGRAPERKVPDQVRRLLGSVPCRSRIGQRADVAMTSPLNGSIAPHSR